MEYKGLEVRQTKNGNIIVRKKDGAELMFSRKGGVLTDDALKKEVDRLMNYINGGGR